MQDAHLDFSFSMQGIDRQAVITEAAKHLDELRGKLGPDKEKMFESPEGAFVRSFSQDRAEFASVIAVLPITDTHFLMNGKTIPPQTATLLRNYNFYWVKPVIILFPRHNWGFHRLEVLIEFNPDSTDNARPIAHQILPDKKFQSQLSTHGHLSLSLNENLEFQAQTSSMQATLGPIEGKLEAGAGMKTSGDLGFTIDHLDYHLVSIQIDHTDTGAEKVFWRLNGEGIVRENTPDIVVIARMPKSVSELKVAAVLQAYHHLRYPASVWEAMEELPRSLARFFKGGMPIRVEKQWDVSSSL